MPYSQLPNRDTQSAWIALKTEFVRSGGTRMQAQRAWNGRDGKGVFLFRSPVWAEPHAIGNQVKVGIAGQRYWLCWPSPVEELSPCRINQVATGKDWGIGLLLSLLAAPS